MKPAVKSPFFSIVTPVYNSAAYLQATIDSVQAQTLGDYEHILIDDSSTDGSLAMCEAYAAQDPRVQLIRSTANAGVSAVRNLGMARARGEYICFLDSDDVWENNKLFTQYKHIEETGAKFLYASYQHMTEQGAFVKEVICPSRADFQRMLSGSVIGCLTVAVHHSLLQGRQFKNIFHEDYLFWLEILRDNQLTAEGDQQSLARYRLRPQSRSANKTAAAKAQWAIYRRHLGFNLAKALPLFMQYAVAGILKHKVSK